MIEEMVEVLLLYIRILCGEFGSSAPGLNICFLQPSNRLQHDVQVDYLGFIKVLDG